jgi:hypothetical protein
LAWISAKSKPATFWRSGSGAGSDPSPNNQTAHLRHFVAF